MQHSTRQENRRRMKPTATLVAIVGLAISATTMATAQAQAAQAQVIRVEPGVGTISAAVARAHPGDTLELEAGTFYDSVLITIPLHVTGAGWAKTVIRPPEGPQNSCSTSGIDGFCVAGAFGGDGQPDRSKPVTDVAIANLRVTGFSDSGIFGINTEGFHVSQVRADHNADYGIARFQSTGSTFTGNLASYNDEAGLYLGDSPDAHSLQTTTASASSCATAPVSPFSTTGSGATVSVSPR